MFSKYEKSRVEKSAQIFGSLRALTAVSHSLLVLELSRKQKGSFAERRRHHSNVYLEDLWVKI